MNQQLKGKRGLGVLFLCITKAAGRSHGTLGGYHAFCWLREETHLPFKDKLNGAWIMPCGWPGCYLPRPGNIPLLPDASSHRQVFGSVQTECLCRNFQLEPILQSSQTRFVPGETDTNSFRTAAATSATLVGLPGDGIKGARKWHRDLK